jgi:hypothetical protein
MTAHEMNWQVDPGEALKGAQEGIKQIAKVVAEMRAELVKAGFSAETADRMSETFFNAMMKQMGGSL